jgi:hypothetical protein
MKNSGIKYWIIDNTTLEKLQVLKQFVDFVAGLEETSPEHKNNAEEVKYLIENLDKPETFKQWNSCIDIYNPFIQMGNYGKNGGIYWKDWSCYFELGILEIRIVERYVDKDGFQDEKPIFYSSIDFNNKINSERILGNSSYKDFINNAFKFRDNIVGDFNDVQAEIDIL